MFSMNSDDVLSLANAFFNSFYTSQTFSNESTICISVEVMSSTTNLSYLMQVAALLVSEKLFSYSYAKIKI